MRWREKPLNHFDRCYLLFTIFFHSISIELLESFYNFFSSFSRSPQFNSFTEVYICVRFFKVAVFYFFRVCIQPQIIFPNNIYYFLLIYSSLPMFKSNFFPKVFTKEKNQIVSKNQRRCHWSYLGYSLCHICIFINFSFFFFFIFHLPPLKMIHYVRCFH